uniref:Ceramide synthase 4 n=1 Tax=Calidris pygmaea TaxID=425635 RepID=A0A8C3KN14_9CHAR
MGLSEGFWHHEYWLPPGATWEDMKGIQYPQPQDLLLCIPGALLLITVRCIFERTVALPLGRRLGVSDKLRPKLQPNATLEDFYVLLGRTPKEGDLISLSKQSGLPVKKVETWFRHRRAQDRPGLMKKFCESSWRFTFYSTSFFSGLALLYDDFKEQIIHHIATITLIFVSYCANLVRFGMIVMLVHDASDYILELAKMLHYMKWKRVCEAVFIVFAVVFIISRLVLFPLITYYYFVTKFQLFLVSCVINAFLMVLQLLHIFWSYLIIQMIFGVILHGAVRKIFVSSVPPLLMRDHEIQGGSCMAAGKGVGEMGLLKHMELAMPQPDGWAIAKEQKPAWIERAPHLQAWIDHLLPS